jgi:hypothetical protein
MGPTGPHFLQAINLTTAKVLGLIFPDKLLALADEAIEKGASFAAPLTAVPGAKRQPAMSALMSAIGG